MRKDQKESLSAFIQLLKTAQEHIVSLLKEQQYATVLDLLQQCQQGAIQMGTMIEASEGEDFPTVTMLEEYCELVFRVYECVCEGENQELLSENVSVYVADMVNLLEEISLSADQDIVIRKQIVFLPYKASMWDSLESIWKAAKEDKNFDVSVVPIPYYDKNPDGSFKTEHYEADLLPEYVATIDYKNFPLEEIKPDIVYIHNPYDQYNYITSVHPAFYSYELKKHTNTLIYVPYYASSGNMSEGQALCSAYVHADYIVLQAEKYKEFIDPSIPKEKLLPLGSPKFDRVMQLCKNLPDVPYEWKKKAEGKKVYFYNTSISGMLSDTKGFLQKMEYVFRCFEGREDACLLWRPHPLLESTFDSMRESFKPIFARLKQYYIEKQLGIYDDTSDIEKSIAFSDVYIGDAGSSVISLFGVAGKPIFILNNAIHSLPSEDDWRGDIVKWFFEDGNHRWRITQGNKLFCSEKDDFSYRYCFDLIDYAYGDYYQRVIEIGNKAYVCPKTAKEILVIENQKIIKKVKLLQYSQRPSGFFGAMRAGKYIFLIPNQYPSVVRYNTETDELDYLEGFEDIFVKMVEGQICTGGRCIWNRFLMLALPTGNQLFAIDIESLEIHRMTTGSSYAGGCMGMVPDGDWIWMLPVEGKTVVCWNPNTGEVKEYSDVPEGMQCRRLPMDYECDMKPYSGAVIVGNRVILSPCYSNMFVSLDKRTGQTEMWKMTEEVSGDTLTPGYAPAYYAGKFLTCTEENVYLYYAEKGRKLYQIHVLTKEVKEVPIRFDREELEAQEPGFSECSQWLQYCAMENAFYTLPDFLAGKAVGNPFDEQRQKCAYQKISADAEGLAGEKIHAYISGKVL